MRRINHMGHNHGSKFCNCCNTIVVALYSINVNCSYMHVRHKSYIVIIELYRCEVNKYQ